ncbi:MAG: tetratricopeptide repeat protein [Terrimicrobiaceae bacterium]
MKNLPAILASLLAGIFSALPSHFDRAERIHTVGAGLISESASWKAHLAAFLFQIGGWGLVDTLSLTFGSLPWFFVFLLLFWGSSRLNKPLQTFARSLVWGILFAVSAMGIWKTVTASQNQIKDLRLLTPLALTEAAKKQPGRIFMNLSARPGVAVCDAKLVDRSIPTEKVAELCNTPQKWRTEDRALPFSAVLLSGTISEAKPLLQHLLESPDWYLARVDNQGLLFLRGQNPDLAATSVPDFSTPRDRAVYLAQYALYLEAAGFPSLASSSMDEALNLARKDYEVLFRASSLSASQNHWESARKQASAAAAARPGTYEAEYLLAFSLLQTGAVDKAFEATTGLRNKYPEDPNTLLLHARTSRAAHDFSEETKALDQLLLLAGQSKADTSRIHIYLAQSWAQQGFPDQALSHYKMALAEGLSPGETRDVRSAITTIEQNRLKK